MPRITLSKYINIFTLPLVQNSNTTIKIGIIPTLQLTIR